MDKEGELKDRLVKVFDKYEHDDDQCCAISFLVDDAKKDFPFTIDENEDFLIKGTDEYVRDKYEHWQLLAKWLKKWLGEL